MTESHTAEKPDLSIFKSLKARPFDNISTQPFGAITFRFGHMGASTYLLNPVNDMPYSGRGFHKISIAKSLAHNGAKDYKYTEHLELLNSIVTEKKARELIAACKSEDKIAALRAYYEENHLLEGEEDEPNRFERIIAGNLCDVIEKYVPFSIGKVWASIDPRNSFRNEEGDSFEKRSMNAFIEAIRFTKLEKMNFQYTEA